MCFIPNRCTQVHDCGSVSLLLVHLNKKLKCTIVVTRCPSSFRRLSLTCHFYDFVCKTAVQYLTKLDMKQELNVLCQVCVFSSPEPKARVSYCHSASSVVRPSVCPSVRRRPSSVNFSHFPLLLQKRLMDFDETW